MNNSLSYISHAIRQFLWKYHFTLFLVLAAGGVTLGIYSLLGVINTSEGSQSTDAGDSKITFDTETIQRVNKLRDSSEEQPFLLPANQRTDPFLEK